METVRASFVWAGPDRDVLTLYAEPTPESWGVVPTDSQLALLMELDDQECETGKVVGMELIGFLRFDRWDALPESSICWELPGWEPAPLPELLKRLQKELQKQVNSGRKVA